METYCAYLRKSRADRDAELRGEGETLARHKGILTDLSQRMGKPITKWYAEVVSGDTIAARPVVQELLADIEKGLWDGVFCVEVERLARGDTIDQGIVSRTFQLTDTKIITPVKTYDPNNEFDSEYFEFSLFMSRREYKTINRRLQAGREASVREGNYIGSADPYGYHKVRLAGGQKGFTLEIVPEEAEVVQNIFQWFCHGDENGHTIGRASIASKLNGLHIPTKKGCRWTYTSIEGILSNPLYKGFVRWNQRACVKSMKDGIISISRPRNSNALYCPGKHPAIIDPELFDRAQDIRNAHSNPGTHARITTISNPFAGLIECGICHHKMQHRIRGSRCPKDMMLCTYHCGCIGSYMEDVEAAMLSGLQDILNKYSVQPEIAPAQDSALLESSLVSMRKDLEGEKLKLNRIFDYLESGIYTLEDFTQRRDTIQKRVSALENDIRSLEMRDSLERKHTAAIREILPKISTFLDAYPVMGAAERNSMLREIVDHAVYTKTVKRKKGGPPVPFSLDIFPKIPPL